jgi:adenylate kinase family enzyme
LERSGPRIAIVGVTGSGKTSLACRLAQIFRIPHVELDALHWQPNWVMAELEPFRRQVEAALAGPAWVTDGNYGKARDLIWPRATLLVWLDYPLPVILWQLTWRTLRRVVTREVLWNSNRETLRGVFFSRDSLLLYALKTYRSTRRRYSELLAGPAYSHLQVVRLRSRTETRRWLDGLETQGQAATAQ